jgi:hypothetical protein
MAENERDIEKVEGQKAADKHPVGNFMWSVAVGSPVISFIVHRKQVGAEFVVTLICINMLLNLGDKLLIGSLDWNQYPLLKIPVFLGYWAARFCVLGKAGAWRMKVDAPKYDAEEFRQKEKIAIIVGLIYSALVITVDVMETLQ